jgi:IS30 family transposase
MRHYQPLTYEQRCQIYVLKKRSYSQREIAKSLGVSQFTVNRELMRNTGARGYRYKQAQERASRRRNKANKATKMMPDMIVLIE